MSRFSESRENAPDHSIPRTGRKSLHYGGVAMAALLSLALPLAAAKAPMPFTTDLDKALEQAQETGKPVVVAFAAVWCPNCRRMEEVTLPSAEVQSFKDRFHWVIIDIDRNVSLAREYDVVAVPQIYFLDPHGHRRRRIVGYVPAAEYAELLSGFLQELETTPDTEVLVEGSADYSRTDLTFSPRGYRGLSICFSHVGYGPLNLTSQSPFQSLRLSLVPRTPSTLAKGQLQVKASGTWANIWANDDDEFFPEQGELGDYLLDYETLHGSASVGYGITDTLQIEGGVENRRRFGGAMDGFIQSFHDVFGIDQSGRDELPKDAFRIFLDPKTGEAPVDLGRAARGSFATNLLFTVQHNVTCGTQKWPAFSYAFTGRYALESDDLEGDDFDFGISVAVARRFAKFYTYLTLGFAKYGDDRFGSIELSDSQVSALLVGEWRYRARRSFVVQFLFSEGAAENPGEGLEPFESSSNEITLGWKAEIAKLGVLEVGLIENVATSDNSPDFGVHVGWTQRF